MVDLIRIAYGFDSGQGVGRTELAGDGSVRRDCEGSARHYAGDQKQMLQSLLEDRFKLKVRKETKPLPTYALIVGKKPQLKEADGTEEPGCRPQTAVRSAGRGRDQDHDGNSTAATTTISLGPGMTIHYTCRNMTMAAFAQGCAA